MKLDFYDKNIMFNLAVNRNTYKKEGDFQKRGSTCETLYELYTFEPLNLLFFGHYLMKPFARVLIPVFVRLISGYSKILLFFFKSTSKGLLYKKQIQQRATTFRHNVYNVLRIWVFLANRYRNKLKSLYLAWNQKVYFYFIG